MFAGSALDYQRNQIYLQNGTRGKAVRADRFKGKLQRFQANPGCGANLKVNLADTARAELRRFLCQPLQQRLNNRKFMHVVSLAPSWVCFQHGQACGPLQAWFWPSAEKAANLKANPGP